MTTNELKEAMLFEIHDAWDEIFDHLGTYYCFDTLPENRRKDLLSFDPNFDHEDFVAMCGTGVIKKASDGLVFMLDGIYFDDNFTTYFVKYTDILNTKFTGSGFWSYAFTITTIDYTQLSLSTQMLKKQSGGDALTELLRELAAMVHQHGADISTRETGKVEKKLNMSTGESVKCHAIIHSAAVGAGAVGFGLAQIPLADNLVIGPIQFGMITSLGGVFGMEVTNAMAKGLVTAFAMGFAGRKAAQLAVGWIPVKGNIVNTITAASLTEAVGWAAVVHFIMLREEEKQSGHGRTEGIKEGFKKAARAFEEKYAELEKRFHAAGKVAQDKIREYKEIIKAYEELILRGTMAQEMTMTDTLTTRMRALATLPIEGGAK